MNMQEWINHQESLKKDGLLTSNNIYTKTINHDSCYDAYGKLMKNVQNPPSNSYIELTNYRKYVPILLLFVESLGKDNDRLMEILKRISTDSKDKSHKRWSDEEDNMLIELVCMGEEMPLLSASLGRTVPAIKSRLTYLVGVKRLSQKVVGKFIGTADGEITELQLEGTLYKE